MRHQPANEVVVGPGLSQRSRNTFAALGERLRSRLRRWAAENPEAVARLAVWASDQLPESTREPDLLTLGRSFMFTVAPPNWQSLPPDAHFRADRLICETGLCLIWVPEADVIVSLLRAPDKDARDDVLLVNGSRILDSAATRVDQVTHPELAGLRSLAIEAVEAYRSGFFASSQALAAAIVTGVIEDHYGFTFGLARKAFQAEAPSTAGLWSHRRALVQRALDNAIVNSSRRTPETGFNRHLTSHGSDPAHYGEVHAIEALMLMAGSLRELNETYRIADMGFGPSPRLEDYAAKRVLAWSGGPSPGVA